MAFSIGNDPDVFSPNQAEPDAIDFAILAAGFAGNGVYIGGAVSAQGTPDMTVAVAAGLGRYADQSFVIAAGNVTITTADATNPRIDLIVSDNTGSKSATAGTPSSNPAAPAIPASSIVLAMVYVPANDTTMGANQITDKRIMVSSSLPVVRYKTADESVISSTTLQDDDHLQFAVDANSMWVFELTLFTSAVNTTGDFKMQWSVPASTTMRWGPIMQASSVSAFTWYWTDGTNNTSQTPITPLIESTSHVFASYNGVQGIKFYGMIFASSTAGTVKLQWAQNFSDANNSTFLKGSNIVVRRLGT